MTTLKVFIGYDHRQPVAAQVLAHTISKHASMPVSITRLQLNQLPITRRGLTEFTYSRFLVPWLCNFGEPTQAGPDVSIFLDSDILCRYDLADLLSYPLAYPDASVFVVDHQQRKFERPSVMVFNNANCSMLTPEYVDNEKHALFDFKWAKQVGALPKQWNHLVGYDAPNPLAHLVHFTQGIPCWPETKGCEFSDEWHAAFNESRGSVSFTELMGPSVHVPYVKQRLAAQGA
jgi:hypothetical protein